MEEVFPTVIVVTYLTRQHDQFLALMNNMTTATTMQTQELNSSGNALKMYGNYAESVAAKEADLANAAQKLASNLISSQFIGGLAEAGAQILQFVGSGNNVITILTTISGILIAMNASSVLSFFTKLKDGFNSFISPIKNIITNMGFFYETMMEAGGGVEGFTVALRTAGITAETVTATIGGIIAVVGIVATVMSEYNAQMEQAHEAAVKAANDYKTEQQSISDLINQYQQLIQKTSLTSDDKTNLESIQSKLISSFGDEAKSLDLVNGKYDDQISKIEKLTKDKADSYIVENQDQYNKAKSELSQNGTSLNNAVDINYLEDNKLLSGTKYAGAGVLGNSNFAALENGINGTLQQRVDVLHQILENASKIPNQTKTEQAAVSSVNTEYTILNKQLQDNLSIVNQMANAKISQNYTSQITKIQNDVTNAQKAVQNGDTQTSTKLISDASNIKNSIDKSIDSNKSFSNEEKGEMKSALNDMINGFGGITTSSNGATSSIEGATNATTKFSDALSTAASSMSPLNTALQKLKNGISFNATDILSLVENVAKLAESSDITSDQEYALLNSITATSDGYTLNKSAVQDLQGAVLSAEDAKLKAALGDKTQVIATTLSNIQQYSKEASAISDLASARAALANAGNSTDVDTLASQIIDNNAQLKSAFYGSDGVASAKAWNEARKEATQQDVQNKQNLVAYYQAQQQINDEVNKLNGLLTSVGSDTQSIKDTTAATAASNAQTTAEKKAQTEQERQQQAIIDNINNQEKDLEQTYKNQTSELDKQKQVLQDQLTLLQKQHQEQQDAEQRQKDVDAVNKAQTALNQANTDLQTVQNDKDVMIWDGTRWTAIADPQKVKDAQDKVTSAAQTLSDAQQTLADFDANQAYQNEVNSLQAQMTAIDQQKTAIDNQYNTDKQNLDNQKQTATEAQQTIKGYATYTANAEAGVATVAEKEPEVITDNKGNVAVALSPAVVKFNGGESVQPIQEWHNASDLINLSNFSFDAGQLNQFSQPIYSPQIPKMVSNATTSHSTDNSVKIDNLTVQTDNGQEFLNFMKNLNGQSPTYKTS